MSTLSQEPDAAFDATTPITGFRPGIPGASGYATVYLSANLRLPIILLSGFDLNETHLAEEEIDYGDPAITAVEVVDRETLKTFVTEAGNYFLALQETGDFSASSKARIALRDPNGPWRHGSVYLYVLDTVSNVILFHGAFPDRFELRPLVATVRDVVTGEFILPQVIEAAKRDPEGGFVEYYFDDPADDTDSADIPKVGYAREFASSFQRADGSVVPVNIIVGSGFYGSETEDIPTFIRTEVEATLGTSGLALNVPNPFNSATYIAYHLSSPGPVRLVIYNVLGQPVRTLVDESQVAGSYQVQWDARDQRGVLLSSGVYITRLSYPGGEQTRRLLYFK
ncbi:MAG: T9SS type A sorting domain-containing protein [Gemmatimonadetes bacterium]|nr:T9SS type A sorting domain-containing protein [Gemmatimonadota bacterium]MYC73583.1 T9SS type A sorting domain-containing protein [Gemmatimonadota bacterium]MYI60586.1 T9SS type A sorting domain-containing protein [Gemmatimonadota bacterium]